MKKYFLIFKTSLIEEFQYILNLLLGFITFYILMFILINLWQYLYADSSIIGGFTYNQMLWYVLFSEILYTCKNKEIISLVNDDIKSGNIAYKINKPYNYVGYILSKNFASIFLKLIFSLISGIILGIVLIGPLNTFNISSLPFIIIVFLFAIIINTLIKISISLLSFWLEDSTPFHWLYDKIILILGTMFPIEVFPRVLQPIIKLSPVFVTTYGASKLIVDFNFNTFITILVTQIIYIFIIILVLFIEYKKGVKKLNVNGG